MGCLRTLVGLLSLCVRAVYCRSVSAATLPSGADTTKSTAGVRDVPLGDKRDVYDLLRTIFGIDVSSSDTVQKKNGTLYVAAIPAVGYSLNTKFAVTRGAIAAMYTDDIDSVNFSTFNFNPT